jgi:hypothetical protein
MKNSLSLLLLVSLAGSLSAQSPATADFKKDLDRYGSQRLQEKLFVHTDKDLYLAGEICWFKLYDVDAGAHHPLDISKVAYLEWLDKDNKPVLQTKIGVSKGHGDGSVYLPQTLRSGNYKLRAYTSWMKNYGADWFFEKMITVVNARTSAATPMAEPPLKYTVTFFPEGGHMVNNITGRIAFRITDQYGRGIECTGTVAEDDQDTVARFQPLRFGIGNFMLTPRTGHRYRSTIRLKDGTAISDLLPAAEKEGMVMTVSSAKNEQVRVDLQADTPDGDIYLIAHTRQSVKVAESTALKEGRAAFIIDRNKLGDGISHLTIFNAARQPVCERLIFKQPSRQLHMDVHTGSSSYVTRKKIALQITSTDLNDRPIPADCSISVFRLDSLQPMPQDHITSYLYLTADLKGKIESPEYYFTHPEDREAMDNLMLTHGWRKFRWEEVLHHTPPAFDFAPEYNGALITGRIIDTRTGSPASNIQGYLSVPGTRTQFASTYCDDEGKVKFEMKDFYNTEEIIVQTSPVTDSMYRLDIDNPFAETYAARPLPPFILSPASSALLTDRSIASQVLNRYNGQQLKQFHFPPIDTTFFYNKPDYTYLLDNYTRFTTMEEVLREYVTSMLVKKKNGHFHLPLFDLSNTEVFENDPLILLDGVPVFDIDRLMTLDPLKIRKLETVHAKYFSGKTYYDGVMNWITYKGDLGGYTLDPHATVVDYEGLQLQREFYSPAYETEEAAASHLPDFRNVLFWSPSLATDHTGKGSLNFYSSDLTGRFIVVVEALAADGTTGSSLISFDVDQPH